MQKMDKEEQNPRETMIEHGTNYSFLLEALHPLTFELVKTLSDRFVSELSEELKERLFDELKRGGNLLETEPQLSAYLHAFGAAHEARFRNAYLHLPKSFFEKETELIDYGCGQAVGAMVYHDFMHANKLIPLVRNITLIDPSERCLRRAALHARRFFPKAEIRTICKYIDDLKVEDVVSNSLLYKLHLFFNIPGMEPSSVEHLATIIDTNLKGYNAFVCVGPFYKKAPELMARLNSFTHLLAVPTEAVFAEDIEENVLLPDEPWTASLRVFTRDVTEKQPDISLSKPVGEPEPSVPTVARDKKTELQQPFGQEAHSGKSSIRSSEEGTRKIDEILAALNEPEESEAVRLLREAAEQGEAKAQNKMGYLYDVGKEVLQNDAEAVRWYRRAAAQGYAMAQYNLGNHYMSGRGVPQDYGEAAEWYRKAAEQDVLPAMNNLGVIYATGQGVKRNEAEAVKWYRKAAEKGDQTALRNLKKRGISM